MKGLKSKFSYAKGRSQWSCFSNGVVSPHFLSPGMTLYWRSVPGLGKQAFTTELHPQLGKVLSCTVESILDTVKAGGRDGYQDHYFKKGMGNPEFPR